MNKIQMKRTSQGISLIRNQKQKIHKMEEEVKPVVHTDIKSIQQKLENLTVGKGILSRKKYISF